jgi:NAD(P)-dependent dehydrogenase (short-subunit alcohol dehydrogenase family)
MRLRDKVALVTGGTSGIGQAAAELFAREGAKVVIAARRREMGEAVAAAIRQSGGDALFVETDVAREEDCRRVVERTVEAYGRIDIGFNNAGILHNGVKITDDTEEAWDRTFAVNVKGVFFCMKHEIAAMLKTGGGAIVNTSSIGGLVGGPGQGAYQASKHAVVGMTKVAALEFAKRGVRVNAVCPAVTRSEMADAWLDTPESLARLQAMHPIGRIAEADEVARAVLFLVSDDASFVTGQALAVDGGFVAQ